MPVKPWAALQSLLRAWSVARPASCTFTMETQLVYDNNRKSLGLRVRETILTPGNGILGNLALKVHGVLNTRTGAAAARVHRRQGPVRPCMSCTAAARLLPSPQQ